MELNHGTCSFRSSSQASESDCPELYLRDSLAWRFMGSLGFRV